MTSTTERIQRRREGEDNQILRRLLEGNYLYMLSAALMILGCYMLLQGQEITGNELGRVRDAVLILQGYEFLLMFTALVILWRFRRLHDGATLVLLQLILLTDPGIFTHNLHTMIRGDHATIGGAILNTALFGLVGLKLLFITVLLRFPMRLRTLLAVVFAMAFIHLGLGAFSFPETRFTNSEMLLVATYAILGLVLLLPSAQWTLDRRAEKSGILTSIQWRTSGYALVTIPVVAVSYHLISIVRVHEMFLHPWHYAPIPLILVLLMMRLYGRFADAKVWVYFFDLAVVIAGMNVLGGAGVSYSSKIAPSANVGFPNSWLPWVLFGGSVALVYTLMAWKARDWRALLRPALGGAVGLIWWIFKSGLITSAANTYGGDVTTVWTILMGARAPVFASAFLLLAVIGLANRNLLLCNLGGLALLVLMSVNSGGFIPIGGAVLLQIGLVYFMVCAIRLYEEAGLPGATFVGILLMIFSTAVWMENPTVLHGTLAILVPCGLLLTGLYWRYAPMMDAGIISSIIVPSIMGWDHVRIMGPIACLLLWGLTFLRRHSGYAVATYGFTWAVVFIGLPGSPMNWVWEALQFAVLGIFLWEAVYMRSNQLKDAVTGAWMVVLLAWIALVIKATALQAGLVLLQTAVIGLIAWRESDSRFLAPVVVGTIGFLYGCARSLMRFVSIQMVVFSGALTLFAGGVALTFLRERLLRALSGKRKLHTEENARNSTEAGGE